MAPPALFPVTAAPACGAETEEGCVGVVGKALTGRVGGAGRSAPPSRRLPHLVRRSSLLLLLLLRLLPSRVEG
eukprot:2373951-Rhodomonas_salina.4